MARFRVVKYRGKWYAQKRLFPFLWRCICNFGRADVDRFNTLRHCQQYSHYQHGSPEQAARTIERYLDQNDIRSGFVEAVIPVDVAYKPKEAAWPENE